ncbi:MAG: DEAD/DEAH box helicase, partial [Deltaproteobacteria bacterium]
ALEIALGARSPDLSLPVGKISVTGAFADLLERLRGEAALQPLPPPEGFQGTLRPYQERGYAWLDFLARFGLGACLADDMGLGKTVQTLAFLQRKREEGETRPVLLICPTSVVNNWRKEAQRFTPGLSLLVHHGIQRKKADAFIEEARKHAIVVSSYNLLQRDIAFLGKIEWAGVILDEAQNVKNPETKQSKAARSLKADFKIALTGTPVENNVGDLWAIMAFLNPGFLGSEASFRRRFFLPIQREGDLEAAERLRAITGPFILRRLKTDRTIIADLPEKQEMKVYCSLTKEQASLYTAVVRDTAGQLEEEGGIKRKGIILATLLKLKQVCNHPAQFLHDG